MGQQLGVGSMSAVFRRKVKKAVPANATRVTKAGCQFARYKAGKRIMTSPIVVDDDGQEYVLEEVGCYILQYRDHANRPRKVSSGCKDEEAARSKLQEILQVQTKIARKLITPNEIDVAAQQEKAITLHIEKFLQSLRAAERSDSHVADFKQKLERICSDCGFKQLADLDREAVETWLVDRSKERMAARTRNSYLTAIRAFLNWSVKTKRTMQNRLTDIERANEKADRRRIRRAMTDDELSRLLTVANLRPLAEYGRETIKSGPSSGKRANWTYAPLTLQSLNQCCDRARKRLSDNPAFLQELQDKGRERMLVYRTLVLTGLRCGELRSITRGQVHLDDDRPHIELMARDEKNREGSIIPLRVDQVGELREWMQSSAALSLPTDSRDLARSLFNVPKGLVRILDRDLAAAGIAKRDDRGRTLDVHALRHTFGTMLSRAGVSPRTAQAAMRHSRIDMTMNVYTDPSLLDVMGAIESLPNVDIQREPTTTGQVLSATGTDGRKKPLPKTLQGRGVGSHLLATNGNIVSVSTKSENRLENEKTLEIIEKTRVFDSEVDGGRTRNLRIDSPVL